MYPELSIATPFSQQTFQIGYLLRAHALKRTIAVDSEMNGLNDAESLARISRKKTKLASRALPGLAARRVSNRRFSWFFLRDFNNFKESYSFRLIREGDFLGAAATPHTSLHCLSRSSASEYGFLVVTAVLRLLDGGHAFGSHVSTLLFGKLHNKRSKACRCVLRLETFSH